MKRRIIAGALVILSLSMTSCISAYIRQQEEAERQRQEQYQQAREEQRQQEEAARQAREEQQRQAEEQRRQERAEREAREEAERQAREEQRRQEQAAAAARGRINLYSAYAGTVLINGEQTQFTAEADKDVNITIENALGNEYTIAVRDSGGTVRRAAATVNIASNSTYYAYILDPNPPPIPGSEFAITQNAQGGITITDYKGPRRQLVIPQTIEGFRVTEIGVLAFYIYGRPLITINIPVGVTTIGRDAFRYNQLTSVTIPNSVTAIGSNAFADNPITEITIPGNVQLNYSFPNNFSAFYEGQGRRAGTYTWNGRVWTASVL